MSKLDKEALLRQIEEIGSLSYEEVPSVEVVRVNENLEHILDRSSGRTRIRPAMVKRFNLVVNQLEGYSPFELRCLWCRRVITYPCWYAKVSFDRSTFLYFVCFSESSSSVVKLACKGK